ncbi:hypothetical protein MMC20_007035 [Loxospora ochrophaea]|nr:hypothetical protein [Loxospora ochrophaea]
MENDVDVHDGHLNTDETQGCYVFLPPSHENEQNLRPSKRRKHSRSVRPSEPSQKEHFVPLLQGVETSDHVQNRSQIFESCWAEHEELLEDLIQETNIKTVNEVIDFVDGIDNTTCNGKIPAGLIVVGSNGAVYSSLTKPLTARLKDEKQAVVVNLAAGQAPVLKSALKEIIQQAVSVVLSDEDDAELSRTRKGPRLLNYDLQRLYDFVQSHSIPKVVVSFQNSEAFDGSLLADLIDVLNSWFDRIPFVLLFGIATSIELFQEKLPRAAIRHLHGMKFEAAQTGETLEKMFKAAASNGEYRPMWLGAGISNLLLQRQRNHAQNVEDFVRAFKYAHMTHFYANPLSTLLGNRDLASSLHKEHFEAVRNLPSFRSFVEDLLDKKELQVVRNMLDDDQYLRSEILKNLEYGQASIRDMLVALDVASKIQTFTSPNSTIPWSELYTIAMSGDLAKSPLIKGMLMPVKKLPSDAMCALLNDLDNFEIIGLSSIRDKLKHLITRTSSDATITTPLRSEHDTQHETLRTTVVAQKVELSKQKSALSSQDSAYSTLVDRVHVALRDFFDEALINPQDLFLHEVFIYDAKSPYRDVFTPKPRAAVERALSSPWDYLGDDCRGEDGDGPSSSTAQQPAVAVLYQLYLESGSSINIADLWSAFLTIMRGEEDGDEDEDEDRERSIL